MAIITKYESNGDFIQLIKEEKVLEIDRFTDVLYTHMNLDSQEIVDQSLNNLRILLKRVKNENKTIIKRICNDMSIRNWLSEYNTSYIPQRLQVIMFSFLINANFKLANDLLTSCGYQKLNARSFVDATVIFALKMQYSFDQWIDFYSKSIFEFDKLIGKNLENQPITIKSLRDYVNSQKILLEDGNSVTFSPTEDLNHSIATIDNSDVFIDFIRKNHVLMSDYRVKSRIRIVESLLRFIDTQVAQFCDTYNYYKQDPHKNDAKLINIYSNLVVIGQLNNGMYLSDLMDKRESSKFILEKHHFESLRIITSRVCDAYTNFYCQSNLINDDAKREQKSVDTHFYVQPTKKQSLIEELNENDDFEEGLSKNLLNKYELKDFEKMLSGNADPNRKFLISFMIFSGIEEIAVLNMKLLSCGFDPLNTDRMSDRFFMEFLASNDKQSFLYQVAEIMYLKKQQFLLDSFSDSLVKENEKIMRHFKFPK